MKKILLLIGMILASSVYAHGNDASLKQAMDLYRKHHYRNAAHLLYQLLPDAKPTDLSKIRLGFGMATLATAKCYRQLYDAARTVSMDHLNRLATPAKKETGAGKLAALYLGKAFLETGDLTNASTFLERFLSEKDVAPLDRNKARASLGTAYYLMGQKHKARKLWAQIPDDSPETRILLATAFQQTEITVNQPEKMADQALNDFLEKKAVIPIQSACALLDIYTQHKMTDKGFTVLSHTDLSANAQKEVITEHKVLYFYDLSLFDRMARFYERVAIDALEKASAADDANVRSPALFYLSKAYGMTNQGEKVRDVITRFLSVKQPPLIYQRARVLQTAYHDLVHHPKAPDDPFKPYLAPDTDPAVLSEIITVCSHRQINCNTAVDQAIQIWQQASGKPPVQLSMALGRYYRSRKAYKKALGFLEAGRDKSRKNRIEANPPLMLIDLARAYYQTRHFSEALEIYFEMSRQFPAVRQIQASLQGVYAMEQQSAGDAKIF